MIAAVAIVVVLTVWRFLVVFGATVFETVGLSPSAAGFESRSLIVGAGYTTAQSEAIVRDPVTRRIGSMLIVVGYFGPATLLALLGATFVVPTDDDLTDRFIVLVVLVGALIVVDRLGAFRLLCSPPARAMARRTMSRSFVETWVAVGDHEVVDIVVPEDPARAEPVLGVIQNDEVRILAVDRLQQGTPKFPAADTRPEVAAGDRVVAFGSRRSLDALRGV